MGIWAGESKTCPPTMSDICRPLRLGLEVKEKPSLSNRMRQIADRERKAQATGNVIVISDEEEPEQQDDDIEYLQKSIEADQAAQKNRAVAGSVSQAGELKIVVLDAKNIRRSGFGSLDPYVTLRPFGEDKVATTVKNKQTSPVWNETFTFAAVAINSAIECKLRDKDFSLHDKRISDWSFKVSDILADAGLTAPSNLVDYEKDFLLVECNAMCRFRISFTFFSSIEKSNKVVAEARAKLDSFKKEQEVKASKNLLNKIGGAVGLGPVVSPLGDVQRVSQFQLRVHLYQATNLIALDDNGFSDPYCEVSCGSEVIKFPVQMKNLNPSWFKTETIMVTLPVPLSLAPDIQVSIIDYDLFGESDIMGRFYLPCTDAAKMSDLKRRDPVWFTIHDNKKLKVGKVLMDFQLLIPSQIATVDIPLTLRPDESSYQIEITTLGLRNLQSTWGVHKTQVVFSLPSGADLATLFSKAPSTKNPNFIQVLTRDVKVPKETVFVSVVTLKAIDEMFGGLTKRCIGSGSVSLHSFLDIDPANPKGFRPKPYAIKVAPDEILKKQREAKLYQDIEKVGHFLSFFFR